jgi:4-diphosphocytidyl-2-C-methyl-D-erythritol kinase
MSLSSYAKINLTLKVNYKNKNNLHEIQSYFCLIDLADKIKIEKIKNRKDKILFKGPFAKLVNKSNNSILSLFRLIRKLGLISNFYSVTIIKNIPVFAGLGGGAANVATILKYLFKRRISMSLLNQVEDDVGSDLKLFFYNQGFMKNLGHVINIKKTHKLFFLLIQPNVKCSTKEIYARVKRYSKKNRLEENRIKTKSKFISYLSKNSNDLQSIVEKKHPIIKELLIDIRKEKGCYFSRMTGSGSVCYGLFNNQIKAKKALNNLKIRYPKFWSSVAKTV